MRLSSTTLAIVLCLSTVTALAETNSFRVGGLAFIAPDSWQRLASRSRMRKAEFRVPGAAQGQDGYCVFYHFAVGQGGSVPANLERWRRQFQEPASELKAKIERQRIGQHRLHRFEASGTFLAGSPGGQKRAVANQTFIGAIIEGRDGNTFIRMVVPDAMRDAARSDFQQMVLSAFRQ